MQKYQCLICDSSELEVLPKADVEYFATGDRKVFSNKNNVITRVICKKCGVIQALQTKSYKTALNEVFKDYEVVNNFYVFSADISTPPSTPHNDAICC